MGFEPTEGCPSNDFESFAFDHSATSPALIANQARSGAAAALGVHDPQHFKDRAANPGASNAPALRPGPELASRWALGLALGLGIALATGLALAAPEFRPIAKNHCGHWPASPWAGFGQGRH